MDFGYSPDDAERYARRNIANDDTPAPPAMTFGAMLNSIERSLDADPALNALFVARFGHRFETATATAKVSLAPFPIEPGTVNATIWDNQPYGRREKLDGDTSRDKPARYALDLMACSKGHTKPLTTKSPDFRANVGDLFTPDQIKARIKRAWKGIDQGEVEFLLNGVLPLAEANGMLVARLCFKRSKAQGGGTHWHPYHYALVSAAEIDARAISTITLMAGVGRVLDLPKASTLDSKGKAFPIVTKTTSTGATKYSQVIGQSRATDLDSPIMAAWATGKIEA